MPFKLGIVGHRDTLQMITELVSEYFNGVEVYAAEFGNDSIIADAVGRIEQLQRVCDGILYSRREPYLLIAGRLRHTVPVRYVEIDSSHLLISILKAYIQYGLKPDNISVDTIDHATVAEALRRVYTAQEQLTIHTVVSDSGASGLVNATLAQHLEHYRRGAQLCITNISDVYHSLLERNIPTALINPTPESFIHEIRALMLSSRLKSQGSTELAVLHLKLLYKEKYRYYGEMPIREIDELDSAAKIMAVFAENLDGAMYSLSRWDYLILCSRLLLQESTNQFVEIDLMKDITHNTVFDIAIGIGCGRTIKEAHSNSVLAANSITQRGTNTMIVLSPEHRIGPIIPKNERYAEDSIAENRIKEIAAATGLSIGTINRLYEATRQRNSALFTSAELAEILEVTTRTVNRTIERLIDNQYAAIAGKNLVKPKGRPARVIRLMF